MSGSRKKISRPRSWRSAVQAAAMRIVGGTQEEAAKAATVSVRTLRRWEDAEWWPEALRDAEEDWLKGVMQKARAAITDGLEAERAVKAGDNVVHVPDHRLRTDVARYVLDRRHPDWREKVEHSVTIGEQVREAADELGDDASLEDIDAQYRDLLH